jgi:hypothetical protein
MRGYNHHKESFFGVRNNKLGADGMQINPIQQSTTLDVSKIDKKPISVGNILNTQPISSTKPLVVSPSIVDSATPSVLPSQPVGQHVETNDSTPVISGGVGGGFGSASNTDESTAEMSTRPDMLVEQRSENKSAFIVSPTWLIVFGSLIAAYGIYTSNN